MKIYGEFLRDDTGAITIDWVALTAGILLLGIMVVYAIFNGGVASLVGNVNETLAAVGTDIDVGIAPALYDMVLASGATLAAGSVVTESSPGTFDETTGFFIPGFTTFTQPDGSTVTTSEFNGGFFGEGLAVGTTVNSGNSFTLADGGGTVTQSSLTDTEGCGSFCLE